MALHGDSEDETVLPLDPRSARLLAAAAAPRSLPEGLRSRLLALPAEAEGEEMQVRRYERARAAGLSGLPLGAPADRTEQAIAGWIAAGTTAGRRPAALPASLRRRLLAIGRGGGKRLPFWLVDPRVAAVACLILTLLSTVLVEDASALLAGKTIEVRLAPREWQERTLVELTGELASRLSGRRDRALAAARAAWRSGEQALLSRAEGAAEGLRDSCEEKLRQFRQTELGRRLAGEPSQQGKNDGDR